MNSNENKNKMALLREIEPLLNGARIFGCTPHRITEKDILVTKWGLVHLLIFALICLYAWVARFYLLFADVRDISILLLKALRTILAYMCIFSDAILTMIWNDKLRNVLANLHNFDVDTRFPQKINITLLYFCRFTLVMNFIFWSTVGYLTYRCEKSSPLLRAMIHGVVNAAISMQLLKFCGFITLLYQRLSHLERLILPDGAIKICAKIAPLSQHLQRASELHVVWWLHCRLVSSAEEINSVYTTQLLIWITTMFLNGLSRIYTLTGGHGEISLFKIRESMFVTACLMNLFIMTIICDFTAAKGNRIGSLMFSPRSALLRKRCFVEDNVEIGMYFHLRKLHFSAGAGLIRIDLPLLLSIGGAMTTYLMILHAIHND